MIPGGPAESLMLRGQAVDALVVARRECQELFTILRSRPYKGKAGEQKQILCRLIIRIDELIGLLTSTPMTTALRKEELHTWQI